MSIEKVSAGAGWHWIGQAFGAIKRQPQVLLVMGLIIGIIAVIPFIGGLVLFILGPALLGGVVYATRTTETGGKPAIGDLMHAFQDNDRTGPMIALCLPAVVGVLVSAVIAFVFVLGAMLGGGLSVDKLKGDPMALLHTLGAGAGAGVFIAVPLIIIVLLAAQAMVFFGVSRVLLDRVDAFAAMKESLQACWKNVGAWLVALLTVVIGIGILNAILHAAHTGWVGSLITSALQYAILGATMYYGYRAVFGATSADAEAPTPAPMPPPPPPVAGVTPNEPPPAA